MKSTLISFLFLLLASVTLAQLPLELAGLELWVRGDSAMEITSNRISYWEDLSGNGNDLLQPTFNWKPNPEPNAIGEHRGVRFDGGNQRMTFAEINNIRSVVWVILEDDDASGFRPVLGHSENYPFFRGTEGYIWHDEFANTEVIEGSTRLDFQPIDGTVTDFESGYHIMNLVTTGDVMADQFAQDRSLNTRWKGVLVELMIFSEALSNEEMIALENYLVEIYSPEFIPMEDVEVLSGFCAAELQASPGFDSYIWSTGAESSFIEVNQSGWYWVDLKDQLGFTKRDSVLVSYPGNLALPTDSAICIGDTFNWDLELDDSYSISWSNGQEGALLSESETTVISATIVDQNSCEVTTNEFNLTVDDLDAVLSIGEEEELCEGNLLTPEAGEQELLTILWNDSQVQNSFQVMESGEVWVEVSNLNGCVGRDTLDVNIIGAAPELEIVIPEVRCNNLSFDLEAQIDTPDGVESVVWLIDDQEIENEELLNYSVEEPSTLTFELYVETNVGCFNQVSAEVEVHETPVLGFNSSLNCAFSTSQWIATSSLNFDELESIEWQYNEEAYEGIVVNVEHGESGFSELILSATSLNGCASQSSFNINTLPVAEVEITSEGSCLSDLVQFNSEVSTSAQTGPEVYRQWEFGDFGVSSQESPLHLYTEAGTVEVTLEIETDNGCRALGNYNLTIYDDPVIEVPSLTACVSIPIEAQYNWAPSEDPITTFEWEIEELGMFSEEFPSLVFNTSDFYSVSLSVESENGCRAETSTVYTAFDLPEPNFSFTPEIGLPPLEVIFSNQSTGATQYQWDFGDSNSSLLPAPSHVFEDFGVYEITLTAVNAVGCSSSIEESILVDQAQSDLVLLDVEFETIDNWVETSVLVLNNSNYSSSSRSMLMDQDGAEILEFDEVPLEIGESRWYTFNALRDAEAFNVLCFNVHETFSPSPDETPEDNQLCTAIEDRNFEWLDPFPSPFNDELHFRFVTAVNEDFVITVTDNLGRVVFESSSLSTSEGYQQFSINSTDWLTGMYVLNYQSSLRQFSSRIIKN